MALSRANILKHAGVLDQKTIHVPAWRDDNGDDSVIVRGMTVREFEVNQAKLGSDDGKATAALVVRCVLDETGGRVFEDSDIDQIAELGFAQVNEIGKAISDLSGLNDAVDAEGKSSDSTPESSSNSDSGSPAS